jgi:hypothetical protein
MATPEAFLHASTNSSTDLPEKQSEERPQISIGRTKSRTHKTIEYAGKKKRNSHTQEDSKRYSITSNKGKKQG